MKASVLKTLFAITLILMPCGYSLAQTQEETLTNLTLQQAYELALKRSETIAIQQQVIKEAQGRFQQSFSTILPQVYFEDTETIEHISRNEHVAERRFTFTQPLFSGFKEFAAMAGSRAERRQRQQELIRAKELLFIDVSDAFYLLKRYEEELNIVSAIHTALQNHVEELTKRESLGRSRTSEVASTQARLYQAEADQELVSSQKAIAGQLLDFLVGRHVDSLAFDGEMVGTLQGEQEYLARANQRSDVIAKEEAFKVAEKQMTMARSGYFPTVNVVGNSYLKKAGVTSNDWDVGLDISVPLFTGGLTTGLVREARAKMEEARLDWQRSQRQAVLDIQNAYTSFISNQKQAQAYKKTVEAFQKSYDLQQGDYKNSLVSNLDVLQALQDLQEVERSYMAIKTDAQRSYWRLKLAAGDLSNGTL